MDFEKQKPVTDEYRENWERLFKKPVPLGQWPNHFTAGGMRVYPNGCPILSETPNA